MIEDKSQEIVCSNCETHVTPLWRRSGDGSYLCNACGLYYKIHRSNRPRELKAETFRHRQRIKRSEKQTDTESKTPEHGRAADLNFYGYLKDGDRNYDSFDSHDNEYKITRKKAICNGHCSGTSKVLSKRRSDEEFSSDQETNNTENQKNENDMLIDRWEEFDKTDIKENSGEEKKTMKKKAFGAEETKNQNGKNNFNNCRCHDKTITPYFLLSSKSVKEMDANGFKKDEIIRNNSANLNHLYKNVKYKEDKERECTFYEKQENHDRRYEVREGNHNSYYGKQPKSREYDHLTEGNYISEDGKHLRASYRYNDPDVAMCIPRMNKGEDYYEECVSENDEQDVDAAKVLLNLMKNN